MLTYSILAYAYPRSMVIFMPPPACSRGIMFSASPVVRLGVCLQPRDNATPQANHDGCRPPHCASGQVHSYANVDSPAGARRPASPFQCKKWNSPQCGQVHYTAAAAGALNDRRRSSAFQLTVSYSIYLIWLITFSIWFSVIIVWWFQFEFSILGTHQIYFRFYYM